jgi:predicted NUDIX family NTP pyrophosphohydrolase
MKATILALILILVRVSAELSVADFKSGIFKTSEPKGKRFGELRFLAGVSRDFRFHRADSSSLFRLQR